VLEISLSADNVFLFALIFASMAVAAEHHHRVLFWGVLGALVFRGTFIVAGVQLVRHFHAVLYAFAIFLIFMGARLLRRPSRNYDPSHSRVVRLARRLFPIANEDGGGHFFRRVDGRVYATPLLLVLVIVEVVDIAFATDSIPAIFSITQDAFIIFASNVLAILCLRSMYFLLARGLFQFSYLRTALAIILVFIGAKMLAEPWMHLPTAVPLVGTLLILGTAVLASLATGKKTTSRNVARPS
jgi:tellurite resistance protein TerC